MDKNIINLNKDENCPKYDIYYILEDLCEFYSLSGKWKNFKGIGRKLQKGDSMKITLLEGKMRFKVNETILDFVENIQLQDNKEIYLLVHDRDLNSKCNITYITEIFQ